MVTPLISIIIPAYNLEQLLGKTLDSVLEQTYANIEVIVVNDGSVDHTRAVIDSYAAKDSRIKPIHKTNGGVTSARLRGVQEASGEWIGFADGDDFIEPQMYERLLANALEHNAQISHCGYRMVFPSRVDCYYNTGRRVVQVGKQACADLLDGGFVEPALCNKLYRKELFAGIDEWMDPTVRNNEDLLMNFYLFRNVDKAIFEDVCPYHYLVREGSAANSNLNEHNLKDPLRVRYLLEKETADMPQWNRIVQQRIIYQLVYSASIALGDQKELIKPFRKEARKELRHRLPKALKGNACSSKLKIMALWVAIWPDSYRWFHQLYAKLTGVDKKYAVE